MGNPSRDDNEFAAVCQNLVTAPVRVNISNVTARSTVLSTGRHRVVCTCDVYLRQGGSTVNSSTADSSADRGSFLAAGERDYITVSSTSDAYLAGITSTGTSGSLNVTKQRD